MRKVISYLLAGLFSLIGSVVIVGAQPTALWKFKTDERIYGSPLIVDSVLYIGSLDGKFYAVNRNTGTEIWNYSTGEEIRTTAVNYDSVLCFANGNRLYGLSVSGNYLWDVLLYDGEVANIHDQWDDFNPSPVLIDSIAYIGTEQGLIYGVNVYDGAVVFNYQTPGGDVTIETTPSIINGKIYFGDWLGVFYCVDLETNDLLWSYDTKLDNTYSWVNAITTRPIFYEGSVLFAGRSCNLYRMDQITGDKIWMYHDPQAMWLKGGPVLDDTTLFMGSSNQCELYVFGVNSGHLLWQTKVDYRIYGTPFVTEDYVIAGTGWEYTDNYGSLFLINKDDHRLKAQFKTGGQVHSSPILVDSIIYFGCSDEYVYAVNINELIQEEHPYSYLKDDATTQLGNLTENDEFSTSLYIYNDGNVYDSVTLVSPSDYLDMTPNDFILNPSDSQLVSFTFHLTDLSSGNYTTVINISPHYTLPDNLTITKRYKFTLNKPDLVSQELQEKFFPGQNYPNPFAELTHIPVSLSEETNVHLILFNEQGNAVDVVWNGMLSPGRHNIVFDGTT